MDWAWFCFVLLVFEFYTALNVPQNEQLEFFHLEKKSFLEP